MLEKSGRNPGLAAPLDRNYSQVTPQNRARFYTCSIIYVKTELACRRYGQVNMCVIWIGLMYNFAMIGVACT